MTPGTLKPKGIILSGDIVRAILAGRKTSARWPINPQPVRLGECSDRPDGWLWPPGSEPGEDGCRWPVDGDATRVLGEHLPHGPVGRMLYGKETWNYADKDCELVAGEYHGPEAPFHGCHGTRQITWVAVYRATFPQDRAGTLKPRWRSSVTMPQWAARIWLRVTAIRAERLHDISEEDAIAEGLLSQRGGGTGPGSGYKWNGIGYHGAGFKGAEPTFHVPDDDGRCRCHVGGTTPAQCAFRELWNSIYGVRAPWSRNPWVEVITFEVTRNDTA